MYLEIVMIASLVILNTTFVKKYLPELRLNLYMLTKYPYGEQGYQV